MKVFSLFYMLSIVNCLNVPSKPPNKFVQEAEIKHGRVAMVSSLVIPSLELMNDKLGINEVSSLEVPVQLGLLALFGISEFGQIFKSYEFPNDPSKFFKMKENHVPGDYNFDPLNLTKKYDNIRNVEQINGRLAMLAVLGTILTELSTGTKIIDSF